MSDERELTHEYDDIIELPHHPSERHPRMTMQSRAAQFSPFAALTGYDDVIDETARLTDRRIPLEDEQKLEIDSRLEYIRENLKDRPEITARYFVEDGRKAGGSYATVTGNVRRIDDLERLLIMTDGRKIPIDDLYSLSGQFFRIFLND